MNFKMVLHTIGKIVLVESALLLLPLFVSLIYGEAESIYFLYTIGAALLLGLGLTFGFKTKDKTIFVREGLITCALAWIVLSLIGTMPLYFSKAIPSFIDALFETVSGFTTTGASILTSVEGLPKGILFWRSFTHWIGGMGILVLVMAILPTETGRSMHIMRAEMPGPIVGKLVPKIKSTAKILYIIYFGITLAEVIFLVCGKLPLYDSVVLALGTAGTGGFAIYNTGLADITPYQQWVIAAFMLLFGVNFNLYYYLLIGNFKAFFKSEELRVYGIIVAITTIIIGINIYPLFANFWETTRAAFFQVASIITTTGYATQDFNQWPLLSRGVILTLMFCGGCAGSTAGGLKISRVMLLFKTIKNNWKHTLHPKSVEVVQLEGKMVDEQTVKDVLSYFTTYIICLVVVFVVLCFDTNMDIEANVSAAISCFNNIGPGLGLIGPMSNYAMFSGLSKCVLTFAMLLGRLEIYPLLLSVFPSTWTKK